MKSRDKNKEIFERENRSQADVDIWEETSGLIYVKKKKCDSCVEGWEKYKTSPHITDSLH